MRRKILIFSILSLLLFAPFVKNAEAKEVEAKEYVPRNDACIAETDQYRWAMASFVFDSILWGGGFMTLDAITSVIEQAPLFGGAIEPLEDAIGFMRNIWMKATIWGVAASFFNWMAGALMTAGIALNLSLTIDNPLINYGSKIILQFVNLGFVISLVFIGIATILRLKNWSLGESRIVWKLIAGAALVNLTIPVVGGMANLGTNVTGIMYKASAPCPGRITQRFIAPYLYNDFKLALQGGEEYPSASATPSTPSEISGSTLFGPFETVEPPDEKDIESSESLFTSFVGGLALDYLALVGGSVMSFIAALTFLAFAAFLLIRYVVLMLLITFSPLIWFGFIFKEFKIPEFGNIWLGWWSQFLKWTFFGPVIVLFLAFSSEYLNSIKAGGADISAGAGMSAGILITFAQLFAVLFISALGILMASKFSGVAGGLVIKGVSGGAGFAMSRTLGALRRGQVAGQMKAEQLKAQGKSGWAVKGLELQSKALKGVSERIGFGPTESPLLSKVGFKPAVKATSEEEIRKKIIERKIALGRGWTPKIMGESMLSEETVKESFGSFERTPENVLILTDNDIKNLSEKDRGSVARAVRKVQGKYISNPGSLHEKQISSLRKLENILASDLAAATVKSVTSPENVEEARNILRMANASINDIVKNGTQETINKMVESIRTLEKNSSGLNSAEVANLQKIRRSFDDKIAEYIVDNLNPLTNPESVLELSNANLAFISKKGTTLGKKKIDDAILQMTTKEKTDEQREKFNRVDAKIGVLKNKREWS